MPTKTLVLDVQNITGDPFAGAVVTLSYDRTVRLASGGLVPPIAAHPVQIVDGSESVQVLAADDPELTTDSTGFGIRVLVAWSDPSGQRRSTTYVAQVVTSDPATVALSSKIGAQPVPPQYASISEVLDKADQAATDAQTAQTAADQAAASAAASANLVGAPAGDAIDAHLGGDATGLVTEVAGITPRTDVHAVGQDEQIVNATDHGADPTGAASSVAAINDLLAAGHGHVLVTNGTFLIDDTITLSTPNQRLTIDDSATLSVASSFTGDVFLIDGGGSSIRGVVIDGGGTIAAQGKTGGTATTPATWTGVHLRGSDAGTTACRIDGLQFNWPGTAFKFHAAGTTGWCNGNIATHVRILYPSILAEVVNDTSAIGLDGNTLHDVMGQSGNFTTYGVKGLTGRNWNLINVSPWDLPAGATSCEIEAGARGVNIVGGLLTGPTFTNSAPASEVAVLDGTSIRPWLTEPSTITAPLFFPDETRAAQPTRVTTSTWPVLSFPDAVISSAGAFWRCPNGVNSITLSADIMGIDASGDVQFSISTQSTPGGTQTSRSITVTLTEGTVTHTDIAGAIITTPGTLYRISPLRNGTNAADTLAGSCGMVAMYITAAS